jgi:hypothetical protein
MMGRMQEVLRTDDGAAEGHAIQGHAHEYTSVCQHAGSFRQEPVAFDDRKHFKAQEEIG